jgi:hypothetical protein
MIKEMSLKNDYMTKIFSCTGILPLKTLQKT